MTFSVSIFILIGLTAIVGVAQPAAQTQPRDIYSLRSAVEDVLVGTDKAGGSVIVQKTCGNEKMVVQPKQPVDSKDEAFDFLTRTNPDYRVIKKSDSINLLPTDYEPEILKTQVDHYVIDSDKSVELALYGLLDLDELKPQADAILLNKGYSMQVSIGPSAAPMPGPRKFKHL